MNQYNFSKYLARTVLNKKDIKAAPFTSQRQHIKLINDYVKQIQNDGNIKQKKVSISLWI